ncbi:MAG TPA: hypothetical protein ENJ45_06715 [Phaeodactylibacter sp.]|nr:hypothetical protein [Phaeodactylibacter sp.]
MQIKTGITLPIHILLATMLLGMISSCGTNRYLKTGQTYLHKNEIVLKSKKRIRGKRALKYELSTILKQKPNTRFLRMFKFRLWAYYRTQAKIQLRGDTTKWNRWVMKNIAEPPSIYNKKIAQATAQSMLYYLQHKGYNEVVVKDTAIHNYRRRRTTAIYTATLNNRYKIDSVQFFSKDTAIYRLMKQYSGDTFLKRGQPVSKDVFDKEYQRHIQLLRNNGYAFFNNSFFFVEGDSSRYHVNIHYEILPPPRAKAHTKYYVGEVRVIPDYSPNDKTALQDTLIDGILFSLPDTLMKVKAKNIVRNIFLHKGDLYKEDNFLKTNLQLRAFDIFKRINIQQSINPQDSTVLDFLIRLTQKKRMVFGADIELNNSNINAASRVSLLGIDGSINFRHRNLFRNAYLFLAEIQGGLDLNLTNKDELIYSIDYSIKSSLYMPRFVDPVHMWWAISKLRIIKKRFYQTLKEKGRSRLSLSYNNLSLFQFYSYNSFNFTFGYELQQSTNNRYHINQFGINYFTTKTEDAFEIILDRNPFLDRSFRDQLFTGAFFKDFSYTHIGKTNRYGRSFFFQANVELSGAEMFATNKIYNLSANNKDTLRLFKRIDYAQFASISLDGRYYKTISPSQSFAARFTTGIAKAFGYSAEVPYVKQFFAGGPNSIRAWSIRELGPGQYHDPQSIPQGDVPFYQTADFKIEMNAEYRFNVFWMLESAIFLDIGNVWTLKEDPNRIGSQLLWSAKFDGDGKLIGKNFIDQMAVGTGFGIRGDFSYFIIRLDLGFKLRNPYPKPTTNRHWRWDELRNRPFQDVNYNLAIGYPF